MAQGQKTFFNWRNNLMKDYKLAIEAKLPIENDDNKVFVYKWMDNNIRVIGYGCNEKGEPCCLEPNIRPGIFGVSSNLMVLQEICELYDCRLIVFNVLYESNNFSVHELFTNYSLSRKCHLVKIETETFERAIQIHKYFKYNTNAYKYICVSLYWDPTKLIMFELILLNNINIKSLDDFNYTTPNTINCWFDKNLKRYNLPEPKIPIITFDIETVSTDPFR